MARIFITGSTDGLGRAAARALMDDGHQVVLHARSRQRAAAVDDLAARAAGVVIGDLSSIVETRSVADQVTGHEAERQPGFGEECLAANKHDGWT